MLNVTPNSWETLFRYNFGCWNIIKLHCPNILNISLVFTSKLWFRNRRDTLQSILARKMETKPYLWLMVSIKWLTDKRFNWPINRQQRAVASRVAFIRWLVLLIYARQNLCPSWMWSVGAKLFYSKWQAMWGIRAPRVIIIHL